MTPFSDSLVTAMLACLDRGGVVITANQRAARSLRLEHSAHQRRAGLSAWQTPGIHDWNSWLEALWADHLGRSPDAPMLLTPLQERAVWKRIAEQHGDAAVVVSADAMAGLAESAFALLSAFEKHDARNRSWNYANAGERSDAEAFRRWAMSFDRECKRNGWMSRSGLAALLAESVRERIMGVPAEVLLVGFDRITPAQQSFLNALNEAGCTSSQLEMSAGGEIGLVEANDQRDEIVTCAWWARRLLERDPETRIGIIVQNMEDARGELERTLRRVLMPESLRIEADETMPFEFSLGQRLSAVPMVKAALLLLRWLVNTLSQDEISWLILSGFFGAGESDLLPLAAFDARLRASRPMRLHEPLEALLRFSAVSGVEGDLLAGFAEALKIAGGARAKERKQSFSAWVQLVVKALRAAGWPGKRALDSTAFQVMRRWERLLDSGAMLDFDGSRVSFAEFVTALDLNAASTIFSLESRDAPVQIMGALESSGQTFDAVWVLGVDDQQWPPRGQMHPLLPQWLQREAAMPHSGAEVDWQLAQTVTRRIAASAPQCVISYAKQNEQGALRTSPLIREVFFESAEAAGSLRLELAVPEQPRRVPQTEWVEDWSAVAWPLEISAGGAEIFKLQAACPFRAFATRRLGARELPAAAAGLTAVERGTILHKVLEGLWSKEEGTEWRLHTRDDLRSAKTNGQLAGIIDHHVSRVLHEHPLARSQDAWTVAYLDMERKRLNSSLSLWLECEALREPFTVTGCEEKLENVDVTGLKLKLRVDRIDRIGSGGSLLIDYKTSAVSRSRWFGERPDEPQLPLYGAYGGVEDLRGIIFAQIRAGKIRFDGCVENPDAVMGSAMKNTEPYGLEMREGWAEALRMLAEEFLSGHAAVMPKKYPGTCRYCALPALCRVAETDVAREAADEEELDADYEREAFDE